MVDFNNDVTITTPSYDVVKIQILERRKYVIDSLEKYYQYILAGASGNTHIFKSRLIALFFEIREMFERHTDPEIFEQNSKIIINPDSTMEDLIKVFIDINIFLDNIKLTKIDNAVQYQHTRAVKKNKLKGY